MNSVYQTPGYIDCFHSTLNTQHQKHDKRTNSDEFYLGGVVTLILLKLKRGCIVIRRSVKGVSTTMKLNIELLFASAGGHITLKW